ncbi:unnamed protein product, partial [marine sediment metagenome]
MANGEDSVVPSSVATGMEIEVAKHSGQVIFAQNAGV